MLQGFKDVLSQIQVGLVNSIKQLHLLCQTIVLLGKKDRDLNNK